MDHTLDFLVTVPPAERVSGPGGDAHDPLLDAVRDPGVHVGHLPGAEPRHAARHTHASVSRGSTCTVLLVRIPSR